MKKVGNSDCALRALECHDFALMKKGALQEGLQGEHSGVPADAPACTHYLAFHPNLARPIAQFAYQGEHSPFQVSQVLLESRLASSKTRASAVS